MRSRERSRERRVGIPEREARWWKTSSILTNSMSGSYSIFESPNKPRAPEPSAQPFLFRPPSPAKAFPAPRKPSFTTPRKPEADLCSSGAEQSSPENADGEDTPDGPSNMQLMRITKDDDADMTDVLDTKRPAKKGLLDDFYSRFNSPGRGELRRGRFSDAITRRVRKRRRPDVDRDTRLAPLWASYDSESDRPHAPAQEDKRRSEDDPPKHASASPALIPSIFAWLESHPNLPHVLSYYAQFFLNVFLVFFFIYIIYSFWATIRSDVDKRSEVVASEVLAEMAACARQFVENRCERDTRVPAMETVCENWERCMNKDPRSVGRAKVSAHTFAEIFNSFVEPISYKAMVRPSFLHSPFSQKTNPLSQDLLPHPCLWLHHPLQLRLWFLPRQS